VYHVLNRGDARMPISESDADDEALERVLEQAVERYGTDLLAWCLMPNHEHLVVKPHAGDRRSTKKVPDTFSPPFHNAVGAQRPPERPRSQGGGEPEPFPGAIGR